MGPERRAVLLLLGLALAGQGIRVWWDRPDTAPGGLVLLPPDSTQPLAAQRQRSMALDRPLGQGEKIDLDKASVDDIARLPRVGRTLAKTIKADRDAHGAFGSLEGLDRVPGVGSGLLAVLAPHAVFSGRPTIEPSVTHRTTVNINAADSAAFERLAGIGPYMAGRIVAYRNRHGSFGSVDDLLKVGGIGPATLAKVRESLALQ
ncbi:MAG TPA: helix-hairpin-helix domain-containing protein [Gemmatimonadales bacterium]